MAIKVAEIFIDAPKILVDRGLTKDGFLTRKLATEIIRHADDYAPFRTGVLKDSAYYKDGYIVYDTPYAHYMYFGKLYVDPITKKGAFFSEDYGFWSRKGVKKELSTRDLNYPSHNETGLRGSFWVERMWDAQGKDILKAFERGLDNGNN